MRERLATLACALGALLLFGTVFLHGDTSRARDASPPTTVERSADGLLAAATWLRAEGVRTLSLRERFGALARHQELPATGNLLIVTLPAATSFRNNELVALDRWIRRGNTLLVLAALRDRPAWAQFPFVMSHDLELLTGLVMAPEVESDTATTQTVRPQSTQRPQQNQRPAQNQRATQAQSPSQTQRPQQTQRPAQAARPAPNSRREQRAADEPDMRETRVERIIRLTSELSRAQRTTLVPNRAHPYFTGVRQAAAFSDYPPFRNAVTTPRDGFALCLAHESGNGQDAFWVRADGDGTTVVSGFGSLFSNRALAVADNARLLANLIAASVSTEGFVVFDDEHQGLTTAYDPATFYRDPRLYATLGVIAAVWLIWVLGGTRLQAPAVRASAPREVELVRTAGLFLARVLNPAAAARRMLEQFLQGVSATLVRSAAREALPEEQLWERLESHPRIARSDVQQLRQWQAAARAGRRVPLIELHNLIVRTESQLTR